MKERMLLAHMKAAYVYADLSYCERRRVGCVVVDGDRIVSIGYNGTPPGEDNVCEIDGVTKTSVIHAEDNALRKLNYNATGMIMFVTTAPCIHCAKLIIPSGITAVYYDDLYKNTLGLELLQQHDIVVTKITIQ